jgi:hypothetical protein
MLRCPPGLGPHRAHRLRQLPPRESRFEARSAMVNTRLPSLRTSSRHRYSVCSETPARRAICAADSYLVNHLSTSSVRSSGDGVDRLTISDLLLDTSGITQPRVQRHRSYAGGGVA